MPSESGFRYETATATSQDAQMAVNKATLDAASRLAATIKSEMEGYTKRVQEENGFSNSFCYRSSSIGECIIFTPFWRACHSIYLCCLCNGLHN